MNFTSFFLNKPVFASILNVMIVIFGLLSISNVTFRELPNIEIPIISVEAFYPNASAEVCEYAVTNVLEEALSKVEGLEDMASKTQFEFVEVNLRLKEGTSIDRTLLLVRDALNQVKGELPKDVRDPRISRSTEKQNGPPFMAIMVASPNRSMGELYHFAHRQLKNVFQSIKGVARVNIWGNPFDMKVILDRKKMYAFGVNVDDITKAFQAYNLAFPAGKLQDEIPVVMDLSLHTPRDFEDLRIKDTEARPIRLKDVASVSLDEDRRTFRMRFQGKSALIVSLDPATDANALEVSDLVQKEFEKQKLQMPDDIELTMELDQGRFIRASMNNVKSSIYEAIFLVAGIIFLFLGNIRASLIPIITIPISLVGAITILLIFGYSLNVITLLAFVLAVGLVVDDAIVVLENIYRHIEEGLSPMEAAKVGSAEIGFAILAMTLTLASVFVPIAFLQGFTGKLLVEFAVTLSGTVLISGIAALTLSPLMCAKILKHDSKRYLPQVDIWIEKLHHFYRSFLEKVFAAKKWMVASIALILLGNGYLFSIMPSELAPKEDRDIVWIFTPQVPGKNIDTVDNTLKEIEKRVEGIQEVSKVLVFAGDWGGSVVLQLKPSEERKLSANDLAMQLWGEFTTFPSAEVYPSSWDSGLPNLEIVESNAQLGVAVKSNGSYHQLHDALQAFRNKAEEAGYYKSAFFSLKFNQPTYNLKLDTFKLGQVGVYPAQVSETLQAYFSGIRSYNFYRDQVKYNINLIGNDKPWDLSGLYVTNEKGKRISIASLASMHLDFVPKQLTHYNQMRSAIFNAELLPGKTIADAIEKFKNLKNEHLPKNLSTEWVGEAKLYSEASNEMMILLILGIVFIFAVLAVQFESFFDPLIILSTVPLAALGALFLLWVTGQTINIYTQVGLLTLIGLITKHGILLVEFANQQLHKGLSTIEAVRNAAELRLRPILMTTLAMVFGAIPLIIGSGAGSESRRAVGLTLIGGLSFGTLLTLTVVPLIYIWVKQLQEKVLKAAQGEAH